MCDRFYKLRLQTHRKCHHEASRYFIPVLNSLSGGRARGWVQAHVDAVTCDDRALEPVFYDSVGHHMGAGVTDFLWRMEEIVMMSETVG